MYSLNKLFLAWSGRLYDGYELNWQDYCFLIGVMLVTIGVMILFNALKCSEQRLPRACVGIGSIVSGIGGFMIFYEIQSGWILAILGILSAWFTRKVSKLKP